MRFLRLTLPLILAFLFGIFGIGIQYVPHPAASEVKEWIALWSRLIGGIAVLLGIYSLMNVHVSKVRKREEGWGYSIFFFVGLAIMVAAALYNSGRWFWQPAVRAGAFDQLYRHLFEPAAATMFSLLGFFIASAAVRTFRARSFAATLLLGSAVVVMLGRAPLGEMLSDYFPVVSEWILTVPNAAAKRGILLGISLGMIGTSLRIIFGLERSYLGGGGT